MSDFSISNARLVLDANALSGTQAVSGVSSAVQNSGDTSTTSSAAASTGQAANVDISKPGELFSKLQKLKTQDPDKYKQVVTDIANQLTKAASGATGKDQQFLSKLAATFQKAEDGSDLQAPQGGPQDGAKSAQALYAQGSQTAQQTTGAHGAHKGHHHKPSAAVEQAFSSISDEIDKALGVTTSSASATSTASAAA